MGASEAPESGSDTEEEVEAEGVGHLFLSESRRFLTEEYPARIDVALPVSPGADLAVYDVDAQGRVRGQRW